MIIAGITLFHILILVYWLGGDLGVFYASTILTDTKTSPEGRVVAAKILAHVDMAPRSAMILTLPSGLTLSNSLGYLDIPSLYLTSIWISGFAWLSLAWLIHLQHLPTASLWRKLDLAIRGVLIIGLFSLAITGTLPLFLSLKLAILATTIILGLVIRRALSPFGAAFGEMVATGPTPTTDQIIAKCLDQSRPAVICIWVLLLCAAVLGIAKPT